jgi:hypothetical protein
MAVIHEILQCSFLGGTQQKTIIALVVQVKFSDH